MVMWETTTIGELLEFKNGLNKSKEFFGKGTPIVNYMDVYKHRGIRAEQLRGRVTLSAEEIRRFDVHKSDVFFTRTSETPEEVGYASVMLDEIDDCVFSGFVLRGRPITDKLDIGYCQYAFMAEGIRKAIMAGCTYTTRALTNGRQLSVIEIPLPDKDEQRCIAEALSDMDALLAAMEKLIAKKRAVKQGTMQELLTGKRRLPGFKGEWMKKRVGAIGYTYSGLTGKNKEHFGTGEANYITFLNVLTNTIIDTSVLETVFVGEHENQNAVDAGDLFFNTSSETPEEVGMCAVLTKTVNNTYLNSFCFGFRLTDGDINGLFLSYYFNSNEGRKIMTLLAQGATRYNLSKSYFNDTVLTIPKLREQTVIAEILSDMDAEIDALTAKLNKLRNIKQGMMSELLTGHIRLTEQEAEASPEAVAAPKIIELPKCKATKHSETNGHGKAIEDAVILAVVTNLYATDQYPLAPFYAQKLPYLLHRHMEGIVRGYHKLAAGPYNAELKYKTALPIAKKNRYVITREEIYMGTTYQAILIGDNIDQAKDYFSQWHGEEPLKWLEQFKYIKNRRDELELLTTVDMAMVELRESGEHISLPAVKKIIQSGKEWAAKLKREIFSDTNITRAIKWSNKLFGMEGDSQ